jgi:hypothetical protein
VRAFCRIIFYLTCVSLPSTHPLPLSQRARGEICKSPVKRRKKSWFGFVPMIAVVNYWFGQPRDRLWLTGRRSCYSSSPGQRPGVSMRPKHPCRPNGPIIRLGERLARWADIPQRRSLHTLGVAQGWENHCPFEANKPIDNTKMMRTRPRDGTNLEYTIKPGKRNFLAGHPRPLARKRERGEFKDML